MSGLSSPPNGRGSQWTRAEREAAGMPLCKTPGCHRAPIYGRRSMCRRCYEASPEHTRRTDGRGAKRQLLDPVSVLFFSERAERDRLQAHAAALGVSASEVLRRALARELAQTPASSGNVSGGPST